MTHSTTRTATGAVLHYAGPVAPGAAYACLWCGESNPTDICSGGALGEHRMVIDRTQPASVSETRPLPAHPWTNYELLRDGLVVLCAQIRDTPSLRGVESDVARVADTLATVTLGALGALQVLAQSHAMLAESVAAERAELAALREQLGVTALGGGA